MERYTSELMRVKNDKSGKYRYFNKVCGQFQRISETAFNLKKDIAFGVENVTIITTRGYTRHELTAVYYL